MTTGRTTNPSFETSIQLPLNANGVTLHLDVTVTGFQGDEFDIAQYTLDFLTYARAFRISRPLPRPNSKQDQVPSE